MHLRAGLPSPSHEGGGGGDEAIVVRGRRGRPYRDEVSTRTAPGTRSMVVGSSAEAALPIAQAPMYKACAMVRRWRRQWRRPEGAPPRRGGTSPTQSPAHCTRRAETADALPRVTAALRQLARRQAIDRHSACNVANGANRDVVQQGNAAPRGAHWRLYGPTERCTRPPLPSATTATPPEWHWRGHTPSAPRPPQRSPSPLRGASQCATHTPEASGAMVCHPQSDVQDIALWEAPSSHAPPGHSSAPRTAPRQRKLSAASASKPRYGWCHPIVTVGLSKLVDSASCPPQAPPNAGTDGATPS